MLSGQRRLMLNVAGHFTDQMAILSNKQQNQSTDWKMFIRYFITQLKTDNELENT